MPKLTPKIKAYLEVKNNPNLAIFRAIEDVKKQAEQTIKTIKQEAEKMIIEVSEKQMAELKGVLDSVAEKSVKESMFKGITTIKGDKGDLGLQGLKGDKGDSIRGERGPQGLVGAMGSMGKQGLNGKDGRNGQNGLNGIPGKDGKDGSPDKPEQIREKLESLIGDARLDAKAIKNLQKYVTQTAQRAMHRGGGPTLRWEAITRTSANTCELPSTPYSSSTILFFRNGSLQISGWTASGKIITTTQIIETDEELYGFYRES